VGIVQQCRSDRDESGTNRGVGEIKASLKQWTPRSGVRRDVGDEPCVRGGAGRRWPWGGETGRSACGRAGRGDKAQRYGAGSDGESETSPEDGGTARGDRLGSDECLCDMYKTSHLIDDLHFL
jgi:hypothetical protein